MSDFEDVNADYLLASARREGAAALRRRERNTVPERPILVVNNLHPVQQETIEELRAQARAMNDENERWTWPVKATAIALTTATFALSPITLPVAYAVIVYSILRSPRP